MSAPTLTPEQRKAEEARLKEWFASQRIVVADGNRGSRTGIAKILTDMGAKAGNITLAEEFNIAIEVIQALKPGIVVTDFDFGKGSGLNLLQEQRLRSPDTKQSVFAIVTGNTSQSAVAQAAEEDVDTYILKPYTVEIFRNCLYKAAYLKLNPSPYQLKLEEGKQLLFAGKADEAIAFFKQAIELDRKPSLACFYAGQAELMKKLFEKAEGEYKQGLTFNKIHYKCMVGLFDSLMERKLYPAAYEVIKKISLYFPANPKRLTSIIRLAVMNNKVEDMEKYHQIFMTLESRSPELTNYICAGLIVCGKYYLKNSLSSRAIDLFNKAAYSSSCAPKFLREIVQALAESRNIPEANATLEKFPPDSRGGPDYLASSLYVGWKSESAPDTVTRGQAMLKQGAKDPLIHEILIQASLAMNAPGQAAQLAAEAAALWPKLKAKFDALLQPAAPASAKAA